MTFKCS